MNLKQWIKENIKEWKLPTFIIVVITIFYMNNIISYYGIERVFSIEEKWLDIFAEGICAALSLGWIVLIILTARIKELNKTLLVGGICFYTAQVHDLIDEFTDLPNWGGYVEDIFFTIGLMLISIGVYGTFKYQSELIKEMTILKNKYSKWSYIDELTGLYNSRYLYEVSIEKLHSALSQEEKICIAMIDIDNFKKYNDTYGHLEGDVVLRKFGELINKASFDKHIGFRYGGEEFLVLFSNIEINEALKLANKIRVSLAEMEFTPADEVVNCTVSIGVSEYRLGDDLKSLINRADQAMYRAKQNGKNRVCLDSEWII